MKLSHKPGWIAIEGVILSLVIFLLAIGLFIHYKNEMFLIGGFGAVWVIFSITLGLDFYLTDRLIAKQNPH